MKPKLTRPVDFDPLVDLAKIAELAHAWRSLFRPSDLSVLPAALVAQMEDLGRAETLRLYLVTRPRDPVALAIIDGLSQDDVIDLLALAPDQGQPGVVMPLGQRPGQRRALVKDVPEGPGGRGVFCFLLGSPEGAAMIDLEPEGLVLAMARWGADNVLDPSPLISSRLRGLAGRLAVPGQPDEQ